MKVLPARHCPIKLSELATVTYKKNKRGKIVTLMLHDNGVNFFDFRTSEKNADRIVSQLKKVNPAIEVK